MTVNEINIYIEEGKMLIAALAFITTTSRTNNTPDEVFEEIRALKNKIYDKHHMDLDAELDKLDEIELYRKCFIEADKRIKHLHKFKALLNEEALSDNLDYISFNELESLQNDEYFGEQYRKVLELKTNYFNEMNKLRLEIKKIAAFELQKLLK